MVKTTEPLGAPEAEEVTFAVYVTELPEAVEVGETVTVVVVAEPAEPVTVSVAVPVDV
jgi:hypothetical protein